MAREETFQCYKIRNTEYRAGECVLVKAAHDDAVRIGVPHYIAKIIHFRKKKKTVEVYIKWYYWPQETCYGRKPFNGAKEVIETSKVAYLSAQTILKKCKVHTLKEFCQLVVNVDDYYCRFRYEDNVMKLGGGGEVSEIPVFCICEQPYNPDKPMVVCHKCQNRFHINCIGRGLDEVQAENYFTCMECQNKKREKMSKVQWKSKSFMRAMVPLKMEELQEVKEAFACSSSEVLVTHIRSNTSITVEKYRCLEPHKWLNDEVINVYLGLLMEREMRDPQNFLKCLFLNTFFWQKLTVGYEAVKSWTKGFSFVDYDKIFVPIHMPGHWCLAVIDQVDQKFLYIDSLEGGTSGTDVMKQLAKYYEVHVKDKSGKDIDVSSWEFVEVKDHPKQSNYYNCGLFMIKYADFYSRGLDLCFDEKDMSYHHQLSYESSLNERF